MLSQSHNCCLLMGVSAEGHSHVSLLAEVLIGRKMYQNMEAWQV